MRFSLSVLALFALLAMPALADGQSSALDRGSLVVDGDASFTSTGFDGQDERATNLAIRPGVKYFVVERLAVGGELLLGYSSAGDFSRTSFGIGPSADYYFGDLDAALHPFVSGTVFWATDRADTPTGEVDASFMRLRGSAGLLYLFSEQVGLNGALFYETSEDEVAGSTVNRDTYGLSVGIAAFVF